MLTKNCDSCILHIEVDPLLVHTLVLDVPNAERDDDGFIDT